MEGEQDLESCTDEDREFEDSSDDDQDRQPVTGAKINIEEEIFVLHP